MSTARKTPKLALQKSSAKTASEDGILSKKPHVKVRISFILTRGQRQKLKEHALKNGVSMTDVILHSLSKIIDN